ncbi:hypothetical protein BJV82DRAFT_676044 [Fennellomyces sp. T-0311]|nr:hypothetical protein BJV82DRAFT_676044 [Fennellomyces sp. T-0311]
MHLSPPQPMDSPSVNFSSQDNSSLEATLPFNGSAAFDVPLRRTKRARHLDGAESVAQATIIGNDDDDVHTMMVKMQHAFNQCCGQLEVDLQLQAWKLKNSESLVGALQEKVTKLEQDNVDLQTQVNELNRKAEQTRSKKVSNGRDPVLSGEIRSYFTALRPHVRSLDAPDLVIADCTMLHAAVQYMHTDVMKGLGVDWPAPFVEQKIRTWFKNSGARSKLTGDERAATNKAAQLVTARREDSWIQESLSFIPSYNQFHLQVIVYIVRPTAMYTIHGFLMSNEEDVRDESGIMRAKRLLRPLWRAPVVDELYARLKVLQELQTKKPLHHLPRLAFKVDRGELTDEQRKLLPDWAVNSPNEATQRPEDFDENVQE